MYYGKDEMRRGGKGNDSTKPHFSLRLSLPSVGIPGDSFTLFPAPKESRVRYKLAE